MKKIKVSRKVGITKEEMYLDKNQIELFKTTASSITKLKNIAYNSLVYPEIAKPNVINYNLFLILALLEADLLAGLDGGEKKIPSAEPLLVTCSVLEDTLRDLQTFYIKKGIIIDDHLDFDNSGNN